MPNSETPQPNAGNTRSFRASVANWFDKASFSRWSIASLVVTVLVVLGGAVVRATGSGAGCGNHWPKCDGEIIPLFPTAERVIEFSHRATSGFFAIVAFICAAIGIRQFARGSQVSKSSKGLVALTIIECLIGAALVRFGWVDQDTSAARAVVLALHHLNTTLLVGVIALLVYWASGGATIRFKGQGGVGTSLGIGLFGMVLVVVSGAMTALGDTLFPAHSSVQAVQTALTPTAHFLEQFRIAHPVISVSATLYLLLSIAMVSRLRPDERVRKYSGFVSTLLVTQIVVGFINVLLKAPLWMQIVHLALSNTVWIAFVFLCAAALNPRFADPIGQVEPEEVEKERPSNKELFLAYVALTKPRIISLLLFTTIAAMFAAQGGWPPFGLFLAVFVGGYFSAGAANAINMVIDSDIDGKMVRTSTRPTVTHLISPSHALWFAFILEATSFALLSAVANVLTAFLALCGLLFYVFIYTLFLKRRTWQNIVIGGAAGAFPPLVGWAAITNSLSPLAWFLFAVIFFWTPVHFWALALIIKDEYAAVGVPMLPVVRGERATVIQITVYAVLTALLCALPLLSGDLGPLYFVAGTALNGLLVLRSVQLMKTPDKDHARVLFKYSMAYLALLFIVIAADRMVVWPRKVVSQLPTIDAVADTARTPVLMKELI